MLRDQPLITGGGGGGGKSSFIPAGFGPIIFPFCISLRVINYRSLKVIKGGSIKVLNQLHQICLKIKRKNYQNVSRTEGNINWTHPTGRDPNEPRLTDKPKGA